MALISMQGHLNEKYWLKHTYFPLKASLFYIHASENITLTMECLHNVNAGTCAKCECWNIFITTTRSWSESVHLLHLGVISWRIHWICTLCITFSIVNFNFVVFASRVGLKKDLYCWGLDPARTYWYTQDFVGTDLNERNTSCRRVWRQHEDISLWAYSNL